VEHDAERENAGAVIHALAGELLRRHVADRPDDDTRQRARRSRRRLGVGELAAGGVLRFRETKVEDLGVDGVALKQAVNAWASAPDAEKAARFASAEAIRWL